MPATNTATSASTVCALVLTRTETFKCYGPDIDPKTGELEFTGERTETREVGRMEFIAMGEWVLVRVVRSPGTNLEGSWRPCTRAEAREWYKAHTEGRGFYRGTWAKADAHTVVVGERDLPACREQYNYGEMAYMYTMVDFPAMTCPVIETARGRCALRPFKYTTPPTPGDRYSHNRVDIEFVQV